MYSSILSFNLVNESEGDLSSITKSGHSGGNDSRSWSVSAFQRESLTQATSGERSAPLGRMNPVDESNPLPVPSARTQIPKATAKSKLRPPVSPPVGAIIIMSPLLVRSMRHSLF